MKICQVTLEILSKILFISLALIRRERSNECDT